MSLHRHEVRTTNALPTLRKNVLQHQDAEAPPLQHLPAQRTPTNTPRTMTLLQFGWSKDRGLILWITALTIVLLVYTIMGEGHYIGWLLLGAVHVMYWAKTAQWKRRLQAHERELLDFANHVLRNQPKSATGAVTGHDLIRFRSLHAVRK
jgi:hypothetical protein